MCKWYARIVFTYVNLYKQTTLEGEFLRYEGILMALGTRISSLRKINW